MYKRQLQFGAAFSSLAFSSPAVLTVPCFPVSRFQSPQLLSPKGILPRAKFIVYASTQHCTTLSDYIFSTKASMDNRKKNLLHSNMSSRCAHYMMNVSQLTAEMFWRVWGTPANSNRFGILVFRYCTDVIQRRPTEVWTMFSRLLGWCTICTFSRALLIERNFARCKIHFASKCCVLL